MSAFLNKRNDETKEVIHLMITDKCNRKCQYCCNNQYSVTDIPIVTDQELSEAKRIYLTGGEPFAYANPNYLASKLKEWYLNIERVCIYTNAYELAEYLLKQYPINSIDGLTISIKNQRDKEAFQNVISKNEGVLNLPYNRLYVFEGFEDVECPFDKRVRTWQKDFIAAPNSIFRRVSKFDVAFELLTFS